MSSSVRILLIEDSPPDREIIRRGLDRHQRADFEDEFEDGVHTPVYTEVRSPLSMSQGLIWLERAIFRHFFVFRRAPV